MIAPTAEGLNLLVFDGDDRTVTTRRVAVATGELSEEATRSFASRSFEALVSLEWGLDVFCGRYVHAPQAWLEKA